jgi:hypothetical protein
MKRLAVLVLLFLAGCREIIDLAPVEDAGYPDSAAFVPDASPVLADAGP